MREDLWSVDAIYSIGGRVKRVPTITPVEVGEHMTGAEVFVVKGAPVTAEVVAASDAVGLVGCVRGGPVNVDAEALKRRGLKLLTTPARMPKQWRT